LLHVQSAPRQQAAGSRGASSDGSLDGSSVAAAGGEQQQQQQQQQKQQRQEKLEQLREEQQLQQDLEKQQERKPPQRLPVTPEIERRCAGTLGSWCVDFYTQVEVLARTATRGNKTCSLDCNQVRC